jgi:hypothetical protein
MIPPLPNPRYEKKFIAQGCNVPEILANVRRHPSAFREVYPPRIVNNIYLDSPNLRDYHDHVNGTANRSKTRVRWYGAELDNADRPNLERKLRIGMVSGKVAHRIPMFSINGNGVRTALGNSFEAASLPPSLRALLQHVQPALFNRYHRHYFLSGDGRFRLTVDSQLRFAAVPWNSAWTLISSHPSPTVILELKFGPAVSDVADAVTNAWPFRAARFSKYVAGIEHL